MTFSMSSKKWSFMHMQTTSNYMTRILILSPLTSVCSAKYGRQIPGIQKTEWLSTLASIMPWFWGLLITSSLLPLKTCMTSWEWLSIVDWISINATRLTKSREKLEMLGLESIYIRELKHQTFLIHERHGWLRRTGSGTRFACKMQIIK